MDLKEVKFIVFKYLMDNDLICHYEDHMDLFDLIQSIFESIMSCESVDELDDYIEDIMRDLLCWEFLSHNPLKIILIDYLIDYVFFYGGDSFVTQTNNIDKVFNDYNSYNFNNSKIMSVVVNCDVITNILSESGFTTLSIKEFRSEIESILKNMEFEDITFIIGVIL